LCWDEQAEQLKNEIVNVNSSASASVVNVNGQVYGYGENEHGQQRSVGADVSHVFQFARLSAHQLSRGLEGRHLVQGHTLAMTLLVEVVYAHAPAADMHNAAAMVADATGVGASTLRSALFQWV
jgi:hypothetical protein